MELLPTRLQGSIHKARAVGTIFSNNPDDLVTTDLVGETMCKFDEGRVVVVDVAGVDPDRLARHGALQGVSFAKGVIASSEYLVDDGSP